MPCQAPPGGPPLLGCCPEAEVYVLRGIRAYIVYNEFAETAAEVQAKLLTQIATMDLANVNPNTVRRALWHYTDPQWYYDEYSWPFIDALQYFYSRYPGYNGVLGAYDGWLEAYQIDYPSEVCRIRQRGNSFLNSPQIGCEMIAAQMRYDITDSQPSQIYSKHILYANPTIYPECCNPAP